MNDATKERWCNTGLLALVLVLLLALTLALIVMLAMALGRIEADQAELMRSLTAPVGKAA